MSEDQIDEFKTSRSENYWEIPKWPKIELPERMKEEIRRAFTLFDETGEGILSLEDVRVAIRALGFDMEPSEMKRLKQRSRFVDNQVDFQNFLKLISDRMLAFDSRLDIVKMFELLDSTEDGCINLIDLHEAAFERLELGDMSDEHLAAMLLGAQISDPADELRQQYEQRHNQARRLNQVSYAPQPQQDQADPTQASPHDASLAAGAVKRIRRLSSSGQQRPDEMTVNLEQFDKLMTISRPLSFSIQML